ncbi:MAG: type II CAAX prenyl endopeptidase Rce1 family protein [Pyrinomonadaceae bacterium]
MLAKSENVENSLPPSIGKALAVWEILSIVTSCLIAEWAVVSFVGTSKLITGIPILLAIGLMVFSHRERGETLRDLGFRTDNFFASCRLLLLPTAAAVLVIVALGWYMNHALFASHFRARHISLPIWALFQQYALNGFINRRAQLSFGKGAKSIILVGTVFALLHLPNPLLATLTLIAGLFWAFAYQKRPNLFALAISHTVASITLALTLSPGLLSNLRVGFKYFG